MTHQVLDVLERQLPPRPARGRERVDEHLHAVDDAPELALLARRPARDRLVVPVGDETGGWIHDVGEPPRLDRAPPLHVAATVEGQAGIGPAWANRPPSAVEVGDVPRLVGVVEIQRHGDPIGEAAETVETVRLVLRRSSAGDAAAIFSRYERIL